MKWLKSKVDLLILPLFLVTVIFLCLKAYGWKDAGAECEFTILHTNDIHAHDMPFEENGRQVGGIARIGHLIKAIKANHKNVLAVDAGDYFQGTPLYQKYTGEVEINDFNMAGYDLATIGNHEFDNGPINLARQMALAKFPIINCNLDFASVPALGAIVKPSVTEIINGQKVAFIGVITPDMETLAPKMAPVKLLAKGDDWLKPVTAEIERCKADGINKIILVTHCGVETDKRMAAQLTDVDAIVGGHSHTRLNEALWFDHPGSSSTVVVQTGSFGRTLGQLHLAFDQSGRLNKPSCSYHLINIADRIKEEPDIKAYLDKKDAPLAALRTEIDGNADTPFDNRFAQMPCDSPIGDLICDALAQSGSKYGATIAFQNRGGIRARIAQGEVSEEKVQELLPFDNFATYATIDGVALLKVLEHSVSGSLGGSFLDVHGIKFGYDPAKSIGERVIFALAQSREGSWQPIEPTAEYKIAINDYTFHGGEAYDFSRAREIVSTQDRLSLVFHRFMVDHHHIRASPPSRIVALSPVQVEVDKASEAVKVRAKGLAPGSYAQVFTGRDAGVSTVENARHATYTLPLDLVEQNPKILRANGDGECSWDIQPSENRRVVAVVVTDSSQGSSKRRTLVSYPKLL